MEPTSERTPAGRLLAFLIGALVLGNLPSLTAMLVAAGAVLYAVGAPRAAAAVFAAALVGAAAKAWFRLDARRSRGRRHDEIREAGFLRLSGGFFEPREGWWLRIPEGSRAEWYEYGEGAPPRTATVYAPAAGQEAATLPASYVQWEDGAPVQPDELERIRARLARAIAGGF